MLAPRLAIVDLETTGMSARTDRVTEIAVLEGIPMTLIHRTPLAAALFVALGLVAPALHAQTDYPSRPMRMIVAFPPGASADLTARTVAQKLSEAYGQPVVVVDNRAGANGSVGTNAVAKSTPDGYTLLLTDRGALGINPSLYRSSPTIPPGI